MIIGIVAVSLSIDLTDALASKEGESTCVGT